MLDLPPTDDRVRDAFAQLTGSVDHLLRPPGVDSVQQTVRRRRQRRIGATAAVAVAVAGLIGLARLPAHDRPTVGVAEPPPATGTLAPSLLLPPYAAPTVAPSRPAPGATPTPAAPGGGGPAPSVPPPTRPVGTTYEPPPCTSTVKAAGEGTELVITAGPVCAGDVIAISWVTYETQRDGSQKLFASDRLTLTEARPRVAVTLRESPTCAGPWYALRADPPIPSTLPADAVEPFPTGTIVASEDGELCLN
ncbi:hypothetical protein AB0J74_07800 [Asanoa sp. NPDC049573]|uniref:hypothetical protein n=1 Tax=Asanoa sp. NPDC049573 TaxID=3155396 RepID=UPI0034263EE0